MMGETYFHQKHYILAIKAYEALVADLRYENWQAASHLQIGKCYERLHNLEQAEEAYAWVTTRFSDSKWAEEAESRLKQVTEAE
jgi:TolA-binding protein